MFVKQARDVWEEIEAEAGLTVEQKRERVKRVVFSDGLDIERAVGLQKGCNELGIGGECLALAVGREVWTCAETIVSCRLFCFFLLQMVKTRSSARMASQRAID